MTQDKSMLRRSHFLFLFFCALSLVSCGSKSSESGPVSETSAEETTHIVDDSAMFVGAVVPLNTNELYIDLYLKDSIAYNDELHELFQGSTDSTIYQDDEIKRSRLPDMIAREYFNLTYLDQLDLFDSLGRDLGKADLQRVEFLEDFIEVRIVAVYKAPIDISPARYGVGGDVPGDRIDGFSYTDVTDPGLNKKVKSKLQSMADTANILFMTHKRFKPGEVVYTFASDHETSFIFDHTTSEVVYSRTGETFINVFPVNKQRKGRPVFLATVGAPETDVIWTMLLVFNGKEYTPVQYQRLSRPDPQ